MKATDFIEAVSDYIYAENAHPSSWEIRQGCDCGCGGDSITDDEWERYDEALADARKALVAFLSKLDIEIDI